MHNIKAEHINLLSRYLLAPPDAKGYILESLPRYMAQYLSTVEEGFINNSNVESTASDIGAMHLLPELRQLQREYFIHLAQLYRDSMDNRAIETLIANNNPTFLEILYAEKDDVFETDLANAFVLQERESLKKKFAAFDEQEEIKPKELESAFALLERGDLKRKLQQLDDDISGGQLETIQKRSAYSGRNWRGLAIAASITGLVAIVVFLLLNSPQAPPDVAKKDYYKRSQPTDTSLMDNGRYDSMMNALANLHLRYSDTLANVYTTASLGFAEEKKQELQVQQYSLQEIEDLEKAYEKEISGEARAKDLGPRAMAVKKVIDSLEAMNNTYRFQKGVLSLYGKQSEDIRLYQLNGQYFLRKAGTYFYIKKSNTPSAFRKVTDKNLLKTLEKIDFEQAD